MRGEEIYAELERELSAAQGHLISEGDPRVPIRVTIKRSTLEAVERQRRKEESLSACIDRLLTEAK